MAAGHAPVEMDDPAGNDGLRGETLHDFGIAAGRHEADVLAVGLVGDAQTVAARERANLALGEIAERKAQQPQLLPGRREEKIALIARGVFGAIKRLRADPSARADT